jgi:hypothetical protein
VPFSLLPTALADLDAVAVDVEHILERIRVGRIEEADHINEILEVGVERIWAGTRSDCVSRSRESA